MSDPREELREAIARAILTPDESYYSDESLFDTDWFERELALHRADCVLRAIDANKDLVLAVMGGKPLGGESPVFVSAERDTLAEMVRLFDPSIEFTTEVPAPGWWMSTKAGRVEVARVITPDQAERFQAVLDRITKETSR